MRLSAAQYAARAGLGPSILRRRAPGGLLLNIDILRTTPVTTNPKWFESADNFSKQAEQFGVVIHYGELRASKTDEGYFVFTVTIGIFTVLLLF